MSIRIETHNIFKSILSSCSIDVDTLGDLLEAVEPLLRLQESVEHWANSTEPIGTRSDGLLKAWRRFQDRGWTDREVVVRDFLLREGWINPYADPDYILESVRAILKAADSVDDD